MTVAAAGPASSASGTPAGTSLRLALRHALASRTIDPARTGALAVDLRSGRTVFQRNVSLSMAPASAEKLTVAFTALRLLGPAFRFRTQVLGAGELDGRAWHGDLYLVGLGDPTLGRSDLASLARQVAEWGIRGVDGRVVADEH
jgi:serine-type D-Ala-D-Ala carboxypeptidase/endopeptidase (penicillin-binding protein 4)